MSTIRKNNKVLTDLAKDLRNNMTKEEKHLWYDFLKFHKYRFVRQKNVKKERVYLSFCFDFNIKKERKARSFSFFCYATSSSSLVGSDAR